MPAGDSERQQSVFFARHPQLRNKRIILFLGRIHAKKGCDLLIKAFAKVIGSDPVWHLVFAGPDQVGWQAELTALAREAGISESITWTGMLSGDMKYGALRAAEVFALPSHQENFGIVVAESLACGTPVLISNKVNIWREVYGDGAGLVDDDDLSGTCSLLESWLSLPAQQKKRMSELALDCFRRRFDVRESAASLIRILSNLIRRPAPETFQLEPTQ